MIILAVIRLYLPAGFATIVRGAVVVEELSNLVAVMLLLTYAVCMAYGIFVAAAGPRLVVTELLPVAEGAQPAGRVEPVAPGPDPSVTGSHAPWRVRTAPALLGGATGSLRW
jgi:hypothetical protein